MNVDPNLEQHAPSMQERIIALSDRWGLFEEVAKLPQIGICQRFGEEWYAVIMYLEAEVHRAKRDYEMFLRENYPPGRGVWDEKKVGKKLTKVMNRLNRCLDRHARATKNMRAMVLYASPSKTDMDCYRILSKDHTTSSRAANGEFLSMYGSRGDDVSHLFQAVHAPDVHPIPGLNPALDYVFRPLLYCLRKFLDCVWRDPIPENFLESFDSQTISALGGLLIDMMAILTLIAAIVVLNTIVQIDLRIGITVVFGLAFLLCAEIVGERALPRLTLVCGFFQVMSLYTVLAPQASKASLGD
ncbi:hypothetical protein IQ07DRAFT_583373 [Pyrenochaeta sp. DS3sAY3a]|nr:hypothetical protein IQ07DRAFT_583373 [Pyrenochaeta sp. DS3sAY3a]